MADPVSVRPSWLKLSHDSAVVSEPRLGYPTHTGMAETEPLETISGAELDDVLERARNQGWTSLALVSRSVAAARDFLRQLKLPAGRTYVVEGLPRSAVQHISELRQLSSLALVELKIGADGARALASLSGLTSLNLAYNGIGDDGARALASLTGLTSLDLFNNEIGAEGARALLETWSDRPSAGNLSYLDLRVNGDLSSLLPGEALDTTDAQAILAAYRRYRTAAEQDALRPLNEAKLLVVGNEAVGKTSLIRYLVENRPRDPDERKTPGAAIHDPIDTKPWLPGKGGVTLNIWDFGGQEIMHGTHRFFLTARSLYLLVLEDRREDDRSVYDWLKTIRNRGQDSPIIVVINKSDEGKKDHLQLDEQGLQDSYPSIVGFVRTCCDPGDFAEARIKELREVVATTLAKSDRLKHVRDNIPHSWLHVKDAVTKMAREQRVLERSKFAKLCEQPGRQDGKANPAITDADEQRALLRLLHDLGVVVAQRMSVNP